MSNTFDELGVTEQYVADKLEKAIKACEKNCGELLDSIRDIDNVDWAEIIKNPESKKSLVNIIDPLDKLANNLSQSMIVVLIAKVMSEKGKK